MKIRLLSILCLFITVSAVAQQKPAYVLYDAKGKKTSYKKMVQTALKQQLVLFGEFHNNPISHWLQLELTTDLQQQKKLVLGAEMFEQDNQEQLNQYLSGSLSAKGLDSNARLWKNFTTDYKPLVDVAKENHLPFVASNIPRRYASLVARGGFEALDTLSAKEKAWIAPLPVPYNAELPGYKKMMEMMKDHGGANMPKAQAIKDATMAYFILQSIGKGELFIHYNGAYHSDFHEGINWYIRQSKPDMKIMTISTVSQKDINQLEAENKGRADFIICVDEDMTTTY